MILATQDSVVRNVAATLVAFCSALLVTFAGSRMPAFTMSTYSSLYASNPVPTLDSFTLLIITAPSRPALAAIQKMLQDDLRLSERRVRRRKLARIISWVLMLVAELLLALMLITQFQMGPEGRVERTPLYRLFYGENQDQDGNPQEEPRPESEWEEQEKKKKKAPSESETSGNTARNAAGSVRSPGI